MHTPVYMNINLCKHKFSTVGHSIKVQDALYYMHFEVEYTEMFFFLYITEYRNSSSVL